MSGEQGSRPAAAASAWRLLRAHCRPGNVALVLALSVAGLLAWLQLSYRPHPSVFSTEIRDLEILIRPAAGVQLPPGPELRRPKVRLAAFPVGAPPLPAAGPREPGLLWPAGLAAAPLPLTVLPPTTHVPPARLPPPPLADLALRPLAASAPGRPPAALRVATPSAPVAAASPAISAVLRLAETPAAVPAKPAPGRSWTAFARPFAPQARRPRVALVLWGLGRSPASSEAAIGRLPGEITFGLSADGQEPQLWADRARAAGHELVLEVPMEPLGYPQVDPGKLALMTTLPAAENRRRLESLLDRVEGYVGITNLMGSRFTVSEAHLRPVLETLRTRGLIFLDSRANGRSIAYRLAGEIGLDRAANNRYIDNELAQTAIDARLAELAQAAREDGAAIGIGVTHEVTIARLTLWLRELPQMGLQLAPLSAVIEPGRRE